MRRQETIKKVINIIDDSVVDVNTKENEMRVRRHSSGDAK
jgi:hypothetical protein